MKKFLLSFVSLSLLVCVSTTARIAFSENVYTPETLPALIKRAVLIDAYLKSNNLQSNLEGQTTGSLVVDLQIESRNGFNVYKENLAVRSEWHTEIIGEASVIRFIDPVTKTLKEGYRGQSIFEVKIQLPEPGISQLSPHYKVPVYVDFQACNKELCLLPATLKLEIPIVRAEVAALRVTTSNPSLVEKVTDKLTALLSSDQFSGLSFLLLFLAGLITAGTPCVYPLYPITIGIFSRWSAKDPSKIFALSGAYSVGMILSYSILGLVAASSGTLFGSFAQNPYFLLSMGLFILVSAVLFSGLISFQAPQFLQNIFMRPEDPNQASKPFSSLVMKSSFMGMGLGVVAAPCVGPVLMALLAWLSTELSNGSSAKHIEAFLLLASFGAGMSLPFLLLSFFVARLKNLPRLGKSSIWIKHIGTGVLALSSLLFIVPALQLLGLQSGPRVHAKFNVHDLQSWPQDKWTVIDFRADWCSACIELENETFTHAEVSPLFESKIWDYVSVDLTHNNEITKKIASDWKVIGLPTVLIVNPENKICSNKTLFGFEDAPSFKKRLAEAQENCAPQIDTPAIDHL